VYLAWGLAGKLIEVDEEADDGLLLDVVAYSDSRASW